VELHENVLRRWQREYEKEPVVRFRAKARVRCGSTARLIGAQIGQMNARERLPKKAYAAGWRNNGLLDNVGGGGRSIRRSKKK